MTIPAANMKQHVALLARMGYDVTFRRPADRGGSYSVTTSTVSGGSNSDETARAVFVNYRKADVDGTIVQRNDRLCLMAPEYQGSALSKTPQVGDQILGQGDPVTVIDVQTIRGASSTIAYVMQVRG